MTQIEQKQAAKKFSEEWKNRGDEKSDTQSFWLALLGEVYGVEKPSSFIEFEKRVQLKHTSFIDAYIPATKILIEQKSSDIDLHKGYTQSDGSVLTPFGQAKRYADEMNNYERPDWIIVCNFTSFLIYNMNNVHSEPVEIQLENLEKEYYMLSFLCNSENVHLKKEMELSIKAGDIVGKIYDKLLEQYKQAKNVDVEKCLKSLNMLCVRLVFCLYAEDAGIFGKKSIFGDYISHYEPKDLRSALLNLFKILDQKQEDRDPFLEEELAAFPYVNGGLFTEEDQFIPQFTDEIKDLLLNKASEDFDWSQISPTIFGAVFESTLNPETRRSGGMHYTSIENIHKVIDPLFMDELNEEYETICSVKTEKIKLQKLRDFQIKLSKLKFLDPACGSGNFLTETYLSLRKLENKVIRDLGDYNLFVMDNVKVSIQQFYGIEINDFAVVVAKTAMWIAESQMLQETAAIVHGNCDFLPLKTYVNITEGNALRIDWESIISKNELNFIMGNPPFVGYSLQTEEQKKDILSIYVDNEGKSYKTAGKIDYVSAWYYKAAKLTQGTNIKCALVSTNSITQGEQVSSVWKPLVDLFGIHIDFAYKTFRWDSEANLKAHVHCVIIGFSCDKNEKIKKIFVDDSYFFEAQHINGYLIDAPDVWIENRSKPICDVIPMTTGNRPADGGNLIIEAEDYNDFITREPGAKKYIKNLTGAEEYINNKKRYCLWLVNANPADLRKLPEVLKRIEACKNDRLQGAPDRQKLAETPGLFRETKNPKSYIIVPATSSEKRKYIPLGFMTEDTIPTNSAVIIPEARCYEFGILTSNIHMAWMRVVCGRLEMRYRYSKDIVYNNFPWPTPTEEQKSKIEQTAQAILDARAKFPDCSLADLYDETVMPPELRKAHQENDKAVMQAYGFSIKMSESECVAELFKMYEKLTLHS